MRTGREGDGGAEALRICHTAGRALRRRPPTHHTRRSPSHFPTVRLDKLTLQPRVARLGLIHGAGTRLFPMRFSPPHGRALRRASSLPPREAGKCPFRSAPPSPRTPAAVQTPCSPWTGVEVGVSASIPLSAPADCSRALSQNLSYHPHAQTRPAPWPPARAHARPPYTYKYTPACLPQVVKRRAPHPLFTGKARAFDRRRARAFCPS